MRSLQGKVAAKRDRLTDVVDVEAVGRLRSIRDFDELVTAPLNGFDGAADYYARCSSGPVIPRIGVPTLLLHAVDDPFLPASAIPRREAEANPNVELALESHGGHVGFVSGSPMRPHFWGEAAGADFLANALSASD